MHSLEPTHGRSERRCAAAPCHVLSVSTIVLTLTGGIVGCSSWRARDTAPHTRCGDAREIQIEEHEDQPGHHMWTARCPAAGGHYICLDHDGPGGAEPECIHEQGPVCDGEEADPLAASASSPTEPATVRHEPEPAQRALVEATPFKLFPKLYCWFEDALVRYSYWREPGDRMNGLPPDVTVEVASDGRACATRMRHGARTPRDESTRSYSRGFLADMALRQLKRAMRRATFEVRPRAPESKPCSEWPGPILRIERPSQVPAVIELRLACHEFVDTGLYFVFKALGNPRIVPERPER